MFSELIFVVWHKDFSRFLLDVALFGTLRMMNEARPFKLVFLVQVPHPPSFEERRKHEASLESLNSRNLLDFLDSPPTIRVVQPYPLVNPYP